MQAPAASPAEAVRHLEQAVALEPGQLNHHLELGFAYLAVGRNPEARAAFEEHAGGLAALAILQPKLFGRRFHHAVGRLRW